ncbi:thiamine pyrophosphate-dependent enzyme [Brevibacterium litoralis]|uniref:thiamine pyrophosphate-dependent enzyme n=1 Tax=Brevibacterium litoralis TaxID=3138935 RepID=UPI0032EC7408
MTSPTSQSSAPEAPSTPDPCSAGHLVVRQLARHGVERVYCVPGESFLDVLDGLHDSDIRTVVCRQEGGVGYMAAAEGRMTGRPGIAMVTRGPGAANVMVGVHNAFQDATPMVVFVGLVPTEHRGRHAFQEFSLEGWFGTTAKKVLVLDDPTSAARVVADAMHTAVSGRPGPVIVGLPEDPQHVETDGRTVTPRAVPSPAPTRAQIEAVEAAVAAAERPVLVVGGESWTPGASTAVADWAAGLGMGIIADFRAYDGIDHAHPHYLGALGFGSWSGTREVLDSADLQVWLGCVRADVPTNSYALGCTPDTTIVIGRDPDALGHHGRIDQQIVSTTEAFAEAVSGGQCASAAGEGTGQMSAAVGGVGSLPWIAETRTRFLAWREPGARPDADPAYVDMDAAFAQVRDLLPTDAIITYGAGNHSGWAARYLPVHEFPSALGPRNGSMGYGVPAAVAAALVFPERTVFSIAGDGCFMMNGQEFATAVQHGANVTIVVNDNSVYGTIRGHQQKHYPGRQSGTALQNPDFAAFARACGGFGARVERTEDFREAFEEALSYEGPAIVHCLTDPEVRFTR